jgi:uncharacterized coiled-coil protein SlyX
MMAIDIIVVCLLLVTIFYCWKLNQKIVELQKGKAELAKLFKHFDTTIVKAEKSMHDLRTVGKQTLQALDYKISEANQAISSTSSLITKIDRSTSIAAEQLSKMENKLEKSSEKSSSPPKTPHYIETQHHNNLSAAQGGIEALASKTIPVYSNKSSDDIKRQAIETLLDRISKTYTKTPVEERSN